MQPDGVIRAACAYLITCSPDDPASSAATPLIASPALPLASPQKTISTLVALGDLVRDVAKPLSLISVHALAANNHDRRIALPRHSKKRTSWVVMDRVRDRANAVSYQHITVTPCDSRPRKRAFVSITPRLARRGTGDHPRGHHPGRLSRPSPHSI